MDVESRLIAGRQGLGDTIVKMSSIPRIVVRLVGDPGLLQNIDRLPEETVHETAEDAARRIVAIDPDQGQIEMEINGEPVEPELIGYWRMLAQEAIEHPDEFDLLVRSIKREIT